MDLGQRRVMTTPDPRIAIPYFTGHGHTRKLAQAIAEGAVTARLIDIEDISDADWVELDAADAIIFGTPTYMGSAAAAFEAFLEEASSRWDSQLWADKIAGGFTTGTYPGGDKLSTLIRLAVYASQMGMIWVGPTAIGPPVKPENTGLNADGSNLGLTATSSRDKTQLVTTGDLDTARLFGARIAAVTRRLRA